MIQSSISTKDRKIINIIVQGRVVKKLCIDCGKRLSISAGYCERLKCGKLNTNIKYNAKEFEEAEKLQAKYIKYGTRRFT